MEQKYDKFNPRTYESWCGFTYSMCNRAFMSVTRAFDDIAKQVVTKASPFNWGSGNTKLTL